MILYIFIDDKRDCENFDFTTTAELSDEDDAPIIKMKRRPKQREFENLLPSKDSSHIFRQ